MHVCIAPEPGNPVLRRCTVLLSLTQTCSNPAHISTPKGAYNPTHGAIKGEKHYSNTSLPVRFSFL